MPVSVSAAHRHNVAASLVMLVALAFAATGCGSNDKELVSTRAAPRRAPNIPIVIGPHDPVLVGISAPISGPDALTGGEDRDAAIVAVERWKRAHGQELRGHDIGVVVEDDGCTEPAIAAQAARRLAGRTGLVGVVGPDCSAGAVAALPVYAAAGIVSISGSATRTDLTTHQPRGEFFFRTAYRNDLEGALIGLFASFDLKARRGYLVDDSEPYGQDLASNAQRILTRNGIPVTRASIARGTLQFGQLTARIVADDPTFVAFMGFNPEAALLYRQLRDGGYRGVFGASDAAATPEFVDAIGKQAEGVLFSGCQLSLPRDFAADFERLRGHPPGASPFTAQDADAMTVLLDGIAKVARPRGDGSLVLSPGALRDAIRGDGMTGGVSGSFSFNADGDRVPLGKQQPPAIVDAALSSQDLGEFVDLGLVPCQVQGGKLARLIGPGARPRRGANS